MQQIMLKLFIHHLNFFYEKNNFYYKLAANNS